MRTVPKLGGGSNTCTGDSLPDLTGWARVSGRVSASKRACIGLWQIDYMMSGWTWSGPRVSRKVRQNAGQQLARMKSRSRMKTQAIEKRIGWTSVMDETGTETEESTGKRVQGEKWEKCRGSPMICSSNRPASTVASSCISSCFFTHEPSLRHRSLSLKSRQGLLSTFCVLGTRNPFPNGPISTSRADL
jgi:hypothetical protein